MVGSEMVTRTSPGDVELTELLAELYEKQLADDPSDLYIQHGMRPEVIAAHLRVFRWYQPHLPQMGAVLDWGCSHGPDGVLIRTVCGDRLDLTGCDVFPAEKYQTFREPARMHYTRLTHPYRLPWPDDCFDAVIASGVLEHVPLECESLKELWRVLKPEGKLLISYLPNRLSYEEWYRRNIARHGAHRRLYGMAQTTRLLKGYGFDPVERGYHCFTWDRLATRLGNSPRVRLLTRTLDAVVPLRLFNSTMRFVAVKVRAM